jgi:hypothetical protein
MSQFTICLEHVSDLTSDVVNASAMKAVPIVSSTPRIIPSRRFMAEISTDEDRNAIPGAEFQLGSAKPKASSCPRLSRVSTIFTSAPTQG